MKYARYRLLALFMAFYTMAVTAAETSDAGNYANREDVKAFAKTFAKKHNKNADTVLAILSGAEKKQSIIDAISRPAEKVLTWAEYQNIFIEKKRIDNGIAFLKKHRELINSITEKYPVEPEMIVAVLGVETRYGKLRGGYRVLDALMTLGFDYEPRGKFFRGQLEQFLLMTDEQKLDPAKLMGSYAGAMGYGQFIPGSYRAYAVDFDGDNVADIWDNPADAIASVANYFVEHKWRYGDFVAWPLHEKVPDSLVSEGLKPGITIASLREAGVTVPESLAGDSKVSVMKLEGKNGFEYWLGFDNFYSITRYNHSHMYAMAAYQLSQLIKAGVESP